MSSRSTVTIAAVVAAGGLALFLYQQYQQKQATKQAPTPSPSSPKKHSNPITIGATPSSAPITTATTSSTSTPTTTSQPAAASSSLSSSSSSVPGDAADALPPPPPLFRSQTLLRVDTAEQAKTPGSNLHVHVSVTSPPPQSDLARDVHRDRDRDRDRDPSSGSLPPRIADVAYLELDIPRGCTLDSAWDIHAAILSVAIQHVHKSLYCTINTDPEAFNASEISTILQRYYDHVTRIATPLRGVLFSSTILFSSPSSPSHPRQRIALIPELQSVLVVAGYDGRVGDLNAKRMALECDLPQLVKTIIYVDGVQSAPTTPVHIHNNVKRYNNVVIGGTFDHLHVGHKIMVAVAVYVAKRQLVIGLSADSLLVNKKHRTFLQPWNYRRDYLISLIYLMNPALIVDIVPLHDVAGPAGDRSELELLVVSEETLDGANQVNEIRKNNGLSPLEISEIKLINSSDSVKISSTLIREQLSNDSRRDRVWVAMEWAELTKVLYLDDKLSGQWWNLIQSKFDQQSRYYHTLTHIISLLRLCECHKSSVRSVDVVRLAIWFHDLVYDPTRQDNEEQSVILFQQFANQAKLPSWLTSKVVDCINDTKTHTLTWQDDQDEQYFLDFDLAILGSTQQEYDVYTRGIALEYSHLDASTYRTGRIRVLRSLLEKERLYNTPTFYDLYEKIARYNISREIDHLSRQT